MLYFSWILFLYFLLDAASIETVLININICFIIYDLTNTPVCMDAKKSGS